jgi:hypothetical protein
VLHIFTGEGCVCAQAGTRLETAIAAAAAEADLRKLLRERFTMTGSLRAPKTLPAAGYHREPVQ